ncbi:MAG: hypothetical protein PVI88_03330 [Nitrosopumilaceae archaeon]|jgi:hypothetical protein
MSLFVLGVGYQSSLGQNPEEEVPLRSDSSKAIPDWLKNNFRWYLDGQISQKELLTSIKWLLDNNYMHLSEKSAREVEELRDQVTYLKQVLAELNSSIDSEDGKNNMESSTDGNIRSLVVISEHQPKVNKLVSNTIINGTQNFDEWSDLIFKTRNDVSSTTNSLKNPSELNELESKAEDLQRIAVLFNTAFDKESGILAAEINLISGMPTIKALSQEDSIETLQEIEKNYWLGRLGKTIEKIESLKAGVAAMQDHVSLIEPDLNSDVADSYVLEDIQRQKERMNEISNALENQQNVVESIIQNIRA